LLSRQQAVRVTKAGEKATQGHDMVRGIRGFDGKDLP
jgi:hypothetical protein